MVQPPAIQLIHRPPPDPVEEAIHALEGVNNSITNHQHEIDRLKTERKRLSDFLCETMRRNESDTLNSPYASVRRRTRRDYGSLTFKYIEHCLKQVTDKEHIIDRIINVIRNNRSVRTTEEAIVTHHLH